MTYTIDQKEHLLFEYFDEYFTGKTLSLTEEECKEIAFYEDLNDKEKENIIKGFFKPKYDRDYIRRYFTNNVWMCDGNDSLFLVGEWKCQDEEITIDISAEITVYFDQGKWFWNCLEIHKFTEDDYIPIIEFWLKKERNSYPV